MTVLEMAEYLMKNTDTKVVNDLLASGMDWNKAIEMAYISVTANH